MSVKTVALDREAYDLLRERKRPTETFSDVVKRVIRPRRPLTDYIGIWEKVPKVEFAEFQRIRRIMRRTEVRRMTKLLASLPRK